MELPFSHEAFLDVFCAYNSLLWPGVVLLWVVTAWLVGVWLRTGRLNGGLFLAAGRSLGLVGSCVPNGSSSAASIGRRCFLPPCSSSGGSVHVARFPQADRTARQAAWVHQCCPLRLAYPLAGLALSFAACRCSPSPAGPGRGLLVTTAGAPVINISPVLWYCQRRPHLPLACGPTWLSRWPLWC
jgi:hypothetical protein